MKCGISRMVHIKCRNTVYPSSNIRRFAVPDDKVFWNVDYADYTPVSYTSKVLHGKSWADPSIEDATFKPVWNKFDVNGKINRVSYIYPYSIDNSNYPLNPYGRTGIRGRGILGRWGPNHAVDSIVTRWKRNEDNSVKIIKSTKKPILQFVSIQRRESGEWALPGGMIDPGEKVSTTMLREFMEEAMNSLEKDPQDLKSIEKSIKTFFEIGEEIYKGYIDDPRNTDNAWIETIAFNYHDETGGIVDKIKLQAGDDAKNVQWIDISQELNLYANHNDLVRKVIEKHKAHW